MSIDLEQHPTFNRIADFFANEPEIANAEPKPESERTPKGTFRNGNRGGPGNPYARRVAKLRQAMLEECREEDLRSMTRVMIERANKGDTAAARLVFQYVLGKPTKQADPDRIDVDELDVMKGMAVPEAMFGAMLNHSVPADTVCKMVQGLWPLLMKAMGKKVEEEAVEREQQNKDMDEDAAAWEALPAEIRLQAHHQLKLVPEQKLVEEAERERPAREAIPAEVRLREFEEAQVRPPAALVELASKERAAREAKGSPSPNVVNSGADAASPGRGESPAADANAPSRDRN